MKQFNIPNREVVVSSIISKRSPLADNSLKNEPTLGAKSRTRSAFRRKILITEIKY